MSVGIKALVTWSQNRIRNSRLPFTAERNSFFSSWLFFFLDPPNATGKKSQFYCRVSLKIPMRFFFRLCSCLVISFDFNSWFSWKCSKIFCKEPLQYKLVMAFCQKCTQTSRMKLTLIGTVVLYIDLPCPSGYFQLSNVIRLLCLGIFLSVI